MRIKTFLQRGFDLWERLEERRISLRTFLILFLCIATIRNLMESFLGEGIIEQISAYGLHYTLFYVIAFLTLSILLSICAGVRIEKVTRLMFYLWLLILLPPLIDLVLFTARTGEKKVMGWVKLEQEGYWWTFFNFYNPFVKLEGSTPGIRIQSFLSCVLASFYVFVKSRSLLRTIITPFFIWLISFALFSLPTFFVAVSSLISPEVEDAHSLIFYKGHFIRNVTHVVNTSIASYQLIMIFFLLLIWLVIYDRHKMRDILSSFEWKRYGHMMLLSALGFIVGWKLFLPSTGFTEFIGNHWDLTSLVAVALSLLGVVLFRLSLTRLTGDETSHVNTTVRRYNSWDVLAIAALIAFLFSLVTSYPLFIWIFALLVLEIVSYVEPFRARELPVVGAFIAGAVAFVSLLTGFTLFAGNLAPSLLPGTIAASVFIIFLVASIPDSLRRGRVKGKITKIIPVVYLVSYITVLYFLWPNLERLSGENHRSPEELKHSIFATFLESDGLDDHAALEFEKAFEAGSTDPWVSLKLGLYASRKGENEEALFYYSKALEYNPRYPQALNNIIILLAEIGRAEEAISYVESLLDLGMESESYLVNVATFYIEKGMTGEGLRNLLTRDDLAATQEGRKAVLRLMRGLVTELDQDSLHVYLENEREKPDDFIRLLLPGAALNSMGRLEEAVYRYERILEIVSS
jgi:hypothetical protein